MLFLLMSVYHGVNAKFFEILQRNIVEIKIGQVQLEGSMETLGTEVKGIGKRLDTQEFINREKLLSLATSAFWTTCHPPS